TPGTPVIPILIDRFACGKQPSINSATALECAICSLSINVMPWLKAVLLPAKILASNSGVESRFLRKALMRATALGLRLDCALFSCALNAESEELDFAKITVFTYKSRDSH